MAHTTINHPLFPIGIRGYLLLIICLALFIAPAMAATTQVHVVKYASDGTTVLAEQTLTYQQMRDTLPVLGDGTIHYYHQGPVFVDDPDDATEQALRWNPDEDTNVQEKDMGAAKGTDFKDLCNLVGGMSPGDTLRVRASDGMTKDFAYANVYGYSSREGPMVLTWYTDFDFDPATPGKYPDTGYTDGMRLVWFADDGVNPWGIHAFGNYDWHEAAAPEYWYYYIQGGENYPTTTGLSVKYVSEIRIISSAGPVAPVAAFTSDVTSGTAPLTVHFTDASTGSPTSWAWDFNNDGVTDDTAQNPSHVYDTAGTYTVKLTVTNAGGTDDEVKDGYITVTPAPVPPSAAFTSDVLTGTAPLIVHFTDESMGTSPLTYAWDFENDGTLDATVQNPSHVYPAAGTYTVKLTVTNSAGSDDEVKTGYITVQSSGGGVTTVTIPADADSLLMENSPDGNGDDIHDYLYVMSRAGMNRRTVVHFDLTSIPAGASIDSATLHLDIWSLVVGTGRTYDVHRVTESWVETLVTWRNIFGKNVLMPISSAATGTTANSWVVWDITSDVQAFTDGTPNYGWLVKDQTESQGTNYVKFYSSEYADATKRPYLEVTYTGGGGPPAPVASFTADTTSGYAPLTVQFTDASTGSPTSWAWDFGDGSTDTAQSPSHTFSTAGTCTVSLTATNEGGSSTETKIGLITVTEPPTPPAADFIADPMTGIAPLEVQFIDKSTGTTPLAYAWDFTNDGMVDSTEQFPSWIYTDPGTYTVSLTVTNIAGSDTETKTDLIEVRPVLTWGPYLTGASATGLTVNAKTARPTEMTVEYATDEYYSAHTAYDQTASDGVSTQLHQVSLAGLAPDTLYHYRVLYGARETGDLHFRTFPESGAFTFVMYSDTQDQLPTYSQLERHKLVADRIAEEPDVLFVLNSGDLVNDAASMDDWDRYFAAGKNMMAGLPVFPARGNHDDNGPNYVAAYGVPDYYSFDCGDGHFTILDSNDWAWPDFPTQSAWLEGDLQATEKPFRFVSFHYPPYSSDSKHFGGYENIRAEWEDEFYANNVLAVFNGHVHAYERFLVNHIHYFVSGTGGGPAYNLATPRAEGSQNSLEYALAYIKVTVDPVAKTATAEVIRVADVSADLKSITTVYPPGTVFETVVMSLNSPPVIDSITAPTEPTLVNTGITATAAFRDPSDTHTAVFDWGDGITSAGVVDEQTGSEISGSVTGTHAYTRPGFYTVSLTLTDSRDATATATSTQPVIVYDPESGFVAGAGAIRSPAGALAADPAATGPATLEFLARYPVLKKEPFKGVTAFQFPKGKIAFTSMSYDWLVIQKEAKKAFYQGSGKIKGEKTYGFLVSVIDGGSKPQQDLFRIRIWDKATGAVVYDTQPGAADTADPTTPLTLGGIAIEKLLK